MADMLKSESHLLKKCVLFASMKALQKWWKIMKNAFYFILKDFFVLKMFKCLSWLFGLVEKTAWQLFKKHKVHFKIYNVTTRLKNNYDKHIGQYLTNKSNQKMKLGQLAEYNKINTFLQKSCRKWGQKTSSRPFFNF